MTSDHKLSQIETSQACKAAIWILFATVCSTCGGMNALVNEIDSELIKSYGQFQQKSEKFDYGVLLPESASGMTSTQFVSTLADKGISYWWNKSEVKYSAIGRQAERVEKNLNQNFEIGPNRSHRFHMQFLAFQAVARMAYEGFAKAAVYYRAASSTVGLEVAEDLILLTHELRPSDQMSRVSVRFDW